jgi:hypothetical protein
LNIIHFFLDVIHFLLAGTYVTHGVFHFVLAKHVCLFFVWCLS